MRCRTRQIQFWSIETTFGKEGWIYQIKKTVKSKFKLPHEELLDRTELEAEQFNLPCPNLATEDTYGGGGEDEVRDRREDGVREVAAAKRFIAGVVES